jgi:hypothetical protein
MSERRVTRDCLRRLLGVLAQDWQHFSDYFYAYKHGGLAVHRPDAAWVDDDVSLVCPATSGRRRGETPRLRSKTWMARPRIELGTPRFSGSRGGRVEAPETA